VKLRSSYTGKRGVASSKYAIIAVPVSKQFLAREVRAELRGLKRRARTRNEKAGDIGSPRGILSSWRKNQIAPSGRW
jgi:hypothetical protein